MPDHVCFLHLLGRAVARFDLRVHAFCLMTNHYHLLVEDMEGHLSRAMQMLNSGHSQAFNRRHSRDGPLLRGRFHSRWVQNQRYALACPRYIHMNPVRAGLCGEPGAWPWSSHWAFVTGPPPPWLHTRTMLEACAITSATAPADLHAFVVGNPCAQNRTDEAPAVLWGDDDGRESLREQLAADTHRIHDEVPASRRVGGLTVDFVVRIVADDFGTSENDVRRGGRGRPHPARDVAVHLLLRLSAMPRGHVA